MAAYLSLTEIATGEVYKGARLVDLDTRICEAVGVSVDPVNWCEGWMDTLGFTIAVRDEPLVAFLPDYIERAKNARRKAIAQWLLDNFENSSYHMR